MRRSVSGKRDVNGFIVNFKDSNVRIRTFLECFDKWKDEADTSCLPPYVQFLISTPVRDVQSFTYPLKVSLLSPISDVIESMQNVRTLLVYRDDETTPLLFSRIIFFEHALTAVNPSEPLSTLVNYLPSMKCVYAHETLDVALEKMLSSGFEEVGVMEAGLFLGVLHVDDIFAFLSREYVRADCSTHTKHTKILHNGLDENLLCAQTSAEIKKSIEQQKQNQCMSPIQRSAQIFCKGHWTEILIVSCIILDISCSIYVYQSDSRGTGDTAEEKLTVLTGIILFIFAYEAFVRVYGFRAALLRLPFEITDLTIVAVSVIVYSLMLKGIVNSDSKTGMTIARILRGLRMFKIVKLLIEMVMRRRMLYNKDGFALDLSFITNNCIAMSVPAVGSQTSFANPIEEVYRFFNTKYMDRYVIYNLCMKAVYSDDYFDGRVERIRIEKHHPPKMNQMIAFVESAGKFVEEDPKACVAIHCKDGRGRTGAMVAAWLMYSRFAESAEDAMNWFVTHRISKKAKINLGIPMPSQQRYVKYMEQVLEDNGFYTKRLLLRKVAIETCPMMDSRHGCNLWLNIDVDGRTAYCSIQGGNVDKLVPFRPNEVRKSFDMELAVSGDVKLALYNRDSASSRDELCCFLCFHTGFVFQEVTKFSKDSVDMASTDTRCKVFHKDFSVSVHFDSIPTADGSKTTSKNGVTVGPFRKILKPSPKVIEMALWMRGRDRTVQIKSATKLSKKIFLNNFRRKSLEDIAQAMEPAAACADNLCCASGPIVRHESVELYKHENTVLRLHSIPTKTFSASKYISQTLGAKIARSWVSGNKRRFVEDGFDLDLSYITPRIIAMGFPSSGIESSYRNSIEEVYRFFQERHAAHYRVVNLCSEREYSLDAFHGNCVRYPFADHNPPALELLLPCCANIHKFLQSDPDNVIAIHCKAGKGRTGLIVIAYLMYCGLKSSALEARLYYDVNRTHDGKGLTIISQIRYAHYFEQILRILKEERGPVQTQQDKAPALMLYRIRLHSIPHFSLDANSNLCLSLCVKSEHDHEDYEILRLQNIKGMHVEDLDSKGLLSDMLDINLDARVGGDFRVTFLEETRAKILFFFVLHSALVLCPPPEMGGKLRDLSLSECNTEGLLAGTRSLLLMKHEIDRAAKDSRCAHFDPDFRVEIFFREICNESGTGSGLDIAREQNMKRQLPSAELRDRPLKGDREAYHNYAQALTESGLPIPSFEKWLLMSVEDLEAAPISRTAERRHSSNSSGAQNSAKDGMPESTQGSGRTEVRLEVGLEGRDTAPSHTFGPDNISASLVFPNVQ